MSVPIYPKALSSWTDRIDQVNTVWAADPNTLAAEILSIEKTLGTMPQVESQVPVGNPVTYSSVSARISDAMLQTQHPYVALSATNFWVGYGSGPGKSVYNKFGKLTDNYGYYNGSDITIKANGLYALNAYQTWGWYSSGYMGHLLIINGTITTSDMWSWKWFDSSGPGAFVNDRWALTQFAWIGELKAGDRVRIGSENGTSRNPYWIANSHLDLYYLRSQ